MVLVSSGFWHLAGQMVMPFYALYVLGLGGSYVDIGLISAVGAIVRICLLYTSPSPRDRS